MKSTETVDRFLSDILFSALGNNTLSGKLDVIRVDLKPSEQFKSV